MWMIIGMDRNLHSSNSMLMETLYDEFDYKILTRIKLVSFRDKLVMLIGLREWGSEVNCESREADKCLRKQRRCMATPPTRWTWIREKYELRSIAVLANAISGNLSNSLFSAVCGGISVQEMVWEGSSVDRSGKAEPAKTLNSSRVKVEK
nr:hypothetical protein Iba_chr14bCG8150 [Ipomoea batatas]